MSNERLELPPGFEARVEEMLGAEMDAFRAALASPAAGLRVNTLRIPSARFVGMSPFGLTPLAFPPDGFLVEDDARPGRHPYHAAGLYYLQDPGAMAVGAMAEPRPGELVLDLAAAPGGKATHLAALMEGEGVLVANDVHAGRARELAGNLERLGVRNSVVTSDSPERLADRLGDIFDRVVVDAPCSGESMFHKSAAAVAGWSPAAVVGCARRQVELMEHAARLVRPGGLIVYSTCTFSPEENEEAIARFLDAHPEFGMTELRSPRGAAPGEPGWVDGPLRREELRLAVRLWPHRVPGAGHFVAGVRRSSDAAGGAAPTPATAGREATPPAMAAYRELIERCTSPAPSPSPRREWDSVVVGVTTEHGEALHSVPRGAPELRGLRVVSAGVSLGSFRKGRFDPAHSLAMALDAESLAEPTPLDPAGPEVSAYLRGETLRDDGPEGWTVVTVDGFALGWGKRVRGVVKNHYPKGLRVRG